MMFLLPGMGATSAMYDGPWKTLHDSVAVDWSKCNGEKQIPDVAERLISEYGISSEDTILGSSLGGIVALEVHQKLNLQQVFLVGSAITREEINGLLIAIAPFAKLTPIRLIQFLAGKGPTLLSNMFADVDADFIKSMCVALTTWEGHKGDLTRVVRIHGERDRIIRCPADAHVISGGGHLIATTHPEDCLRIIDETAC